MAATFKFSTLADYTAAKGSSGSIYAALVNSDVVSRSAVSYITSTGQTFVDSINDIVPELDGQIGDCLMYCSKDAKFYWLKSNRSWTASDFGGSYIDATDLTNAGYTRIGFMVDREGDRCSIMSMSNTSSTLAYCPNTSTTIPNVFTNSGIRCGDSLSWIASGSIYMGELYGSSQSSNYYQYTYPVSREVWKTVVDAIFSNTAIAETTHPGGKYSVTKGTHIGVGSITYTTQVTKTINPADFDYDFDKWYKARLLVTIPATDGCMMDTHGGRANTKALIQWASANSTTVPAASGCNSWSVAVNGFEAGEWWLPSVYELWKALENYEILAKKGAGITRSWYWSSSQSSSSGAWYVYFLTGYVHSRGAKSGAHAVRPFTSHTIARQ